MPDPAVTIVSVTYQSEQTIDAALSASRSAYEAGIARQVVVDNDSTDGTVALIREHHPWVSLIENGANVGFARGCNRGAQDVQTPYLLFLNPDAAIDAAGLRTLVDFLDGHREVGIVGPAIDKGEGDWHHVGGVPTPGKMIGSALGYQREDASIRTLRGGEKPFETDWVCGAAIMIRTELFRELGGFDPRFFLYFDETDLCVRARQRGAAVWAVGEAVVRHAGAHSAQQVEKEGMYYDCIARYFFASRFYYLVKHHGYAAAMTAETLELLGCGARDVVRWVLRRPGRGELRRRLQGPVFRMPDRPQAVEAVEAESRMEACSR